MHPKFYSPNGKLLFSKSISNFKIRKWNKISTGDCQEQRQHGPAEGFQGEVTQTQEILDLNQQ